MKQITNDSVSLLLKSKIDQKAHRDSCNMGVLSFPRQMHSPTPDGISAAPFKKPLHSLCIINGDPVSCLR